MSIVPPAFLELPANTRIHSNNELMCNVQFASHIVQCAISAVCSVKCAGFSVLSANCSVQCAVCDL